MANSGRNMPEAHRHMPEAHPNMLEGHRPASSLVGGPPTRAVTPILDLADAPVVAGTPAGARLLGGGCGDCGVRWFPYRQVCPSCAGARVERVLLGPSGTLYSWSTVHVSSSRPVPYTLGYVDLDEGVRVLATIEASGELTLGVRCRLVVGPTATAPVPATPPALAAPRWWFEPEGDAS